MADETTTPAATPASTAAPEQPTSDEVKLSSKALKERLDEERGKGRSNVLKELGFEKLSDLQAVLKLHKETEDAKLSENERLKKQLDEWKPKLERVSVLEERVREWADTQFAALPSNIQEAVDDIAGGNAEERLRVIAMFKKRGLIGEQAAPQSAPAPSSAPPKANTAGAPAPKSSPVKTPYEEFAELDRKNPIQASIFYSLNRQAIEESRPQ
jgi:hypothetical protein